MAINTRRSSAQRPPGSAGLPGLGETLAFTRDPFGFVRERRERYGRVFRTNLLGRMTAVLAGPEPLAAFYDPQNVMRAGSNPASVQTMFGGDGVINNLDGDAHATRKQFVMAALSHDAIESYMPTMARFINAAFARWTRAGEIRWNDEIKQLTIAMLGAVFTSAEPGEQLRALVNRLEAVATAATALPIPLPGTAFTKGVRAKDEALAYYRDLVRAHRARAYEDGLARILAVRSTDGTSISDDEAAGELQHLFLAGYVAFAQFVATVLHLTARPDVHDHLAQETATLSVTPSAADLVTLPYLMQVVNEVRRLTPIVPVVFGKARRTFVIDGFEIPAGWAVAAAVWQHDQEAATFREPESFDPERFGTRAEHMQNRFAYAPQGAGPPDGHRCPGFDLTTILMALFAARLVRVCTWVLPQQDLSLNWALLPPAPKDGLRAVVRTLPSAAGVAGVLGSPSGQAVFAEGAVFGDSKNGSGVLATSANASAIVAASTNSFGINGITFNNSTVSKGSASGVIGSDATSDGGHLNSGVQGNSTNGIGVVATSTNWVGADITGGLNNTNGMSLLPALSIVERQSNGFGTDLIDGCVQSTVDPCDASHAVFSVNGGILFAAAALETLGPDESSNIFSGCAAIGFFANCTNNGDVDITGHYLKNGNCVAGCTAPTKTTPGRALVTYAATVSQPTVEDFGEAQLSGGEAYVPLDHRFANAIDQATAYMVFITPEGDANALYVTQRTLSGFLVRESHGGRSSIAFSYRIVSKPYGSHEARLPMVTIPKLASEGARAHHKWSAAKTGLSERR